MARGDLIELQLYQRYETASAVKFTQTDQSDDEEETWVPKSLIESKEPIAAKRNWFRVEVPEWFAEREGLV